MNEFALKNWVPYKLKNDSGQLECHWLNTGGEKFTEPFFEETIMKCRSRHNRYFYFPSVSSPDMILDWGANLDKVVPAAIIFHISRCGSTLVSQMLATLPENIVLSEIPFFDDLLRLPFKYPQFTKTYISSLLKASINFYGQKKSTEEKNVFIKTDSWQIFFYEQLRRLYPSVPFIFLYRRPDEVFNSHKKLPGIFSVPGLIEPAVFGVKNEYLTCSPDEYFASVLESHLKKTIEILETDNNSLFINYNEGPVPMVKKIADFTKISFNEQEWLNMEQRSLYHSKKTGELFSEKQPFMGTRCLGPAWRFYDLLEEKRRDSN